MALRNIIVSAVLAICLAASLLITAGCSGGMKVSTAGISEAIMCSGVNPQTGQPVDNVDIFDTSAPEIFCSVKLSNTPSDTEVRAVWIYIGGEIKELSNHVIDEYTLTAEGNSYVFFSLSASSKGWPQGDYAVKLYLDGIEKMTVPFTVRSTTLSYGI